LASTQKKQYIKAGRKNHKQNKQEGLAVASIAQDDHSPLPGMHRDHNAPACTATRSAYGRIVGYAVNLERNLKPKLAIMRQCTSVTDRWKDRWTL